MIQSSCSELLVDTQIHDPLVAFNNFTKLFQTMQWESSPPLTVKLLKQLKRKGSDRSVLVYDAFGNRCYLEYGNNGYISDLGYRLDSGCNHCDTRCFPMFKAAIEHMYGELHSCDGGSTQPYEEWEDLHDSSNLSKSE